MIICPWKEIRRYAAIIPGLEAAIAAVDALETLEPATYPLPDGCKFMIQAGTTKSAEGALSEAHRKFLDIQYIIQGEETMGWAPLDTLTPANEFNTEKDVGKYDGHCEFVRIPAGYCYVVFPEDAHMPGVHLETPTEYCKAVIKLKV